MSVFVAVTDSALELRRVPIDAYLAGTRRSVPLELVSEEAHESVQLAAEQDDWLEVSFDDGENWTPLGDDPTDGLEVGPLAEGERLPLLLAVNHADAFRQRRIPVLIGLGT